MTHWLQVPYTSGAKLLFAQLAEDARTSNKRIALFGDSQEDTTSESTCVDLSFHSWQKLGRVHESCICPPFNHGTTADSSLFWLSAGAATGDSTKATTASYIPPGKSVTQSGTYPLGCVRHLLAYKADTNWLQSAGDYTILDPTSGCVADIFLYTKSSGPAEIKWNSAPVATGPSAGSISATVNASEVTTTLELDASSNVGKRYRTGTLPYDGAKPYAQLIYGGHDGSSYVAGTEMAGARFISLAGAGGLVWEPFSVGGYNTEHIAANHANAGPMFTLMGGPDGWSAIAIGLMNNNAFSLDDTLEEYETKLSALITLLRTWTGTTTPIVLLADPPTTGSGWPVGTHDNFNQYASVQADLANSLQDVMAINTQRLMYDFGYDPADTTYCIDGTHPTRLGANIRAATIVSALFGEGFVGSGSSGPTTAEIVAAINADATQTAARTAALQAAKFNKNKRTRLVVSATQWRYSCYDDDETTVLYQMDFNPQTGEVEEV